MPETPRVGLFVTCLVDLFRPSVGFAAVQLIEKSGCSVEVPVNVTCCGQPAYNSGDKADTRDIARQAIEAYKGFDYVVAPSGSCASMLKHHYPRLFEDDAAGLKKAEDFAGRVHELMSFLVDVRGMTSVSARFPAKVTYHDSCSGLRECGVKEQPRKLLETVQDLTLVEMKDSEVCCGFGGTFSVKYPEVSNAIVEAKTRNISDSEADCLLAGDVGCLMNMAGKITRDGKPVEVRHVAEILAGMTDEPAIAASGSKRR